MKKNEVIKKLLIGAIVAMILCISTVINASSNLNEIIDTIPVINDEKKPSNVTTLGTNTTGTSKGNNTNTNKTLPKTGVDDTVMWALIGVSAVAAIYTYKKVRDYNV